MTQLFRLIPKAPGPRAWAFFFSCTNSLWIGLPRESLAAPRNYSAAIRHLGAVILASFFLDVEKP
jgi:hypothetical protein